MMEATAALLRDASHITAARSGRRRMTDVGGLAFAERVPAGAAKRGGDQDGNNHGDKGCDFHSGDLLLLRDNVS